MPLLHYGQDATIQFEPLNGHLLCERGRPGATPLADVRSATAAVLAAPLDYPPLARSATPGDRVVLALDEGLPQKAQVTAAAVLALIEAGVDADGITILQTAAAAAEGRSPCCLLDAALRDRIRLLTHDPQDRAGLAYLAATAAGDPIMLHRALHEADVVLPIGCLHRPSAAGYFGIHGVVFPNFSDESTRMRFRDPAAVDPARRQRLIDEVNEVAWLLGLHFTVQVLPGNGDELLDVLAGQSAAVACRGATLYRDAWSGSVAHRASLVVAAIEGGAGQQTWENLGRALAAALQLAEDGGAIAVCCELGAAPGPAVRQLAKAPKRAKALHRIEREPPVDALPATQLARALEYGSLYLLSRLDPSFCEQLDIIPLEGDELVRLARQHESCILLSNAARAIVTVADEV